MAHGFNFGDRSDVRRELPNYFAAYDPHLESNLSLQNVLLGGADHSTPSDVVHRLRQAGQEQRSRDEQRSSPSFPARLPPNFPEHSRARATDQLLGQQQHDAVNDDRGTIRQRDDMATNVDLLALSAQVAALTESLNKLHACVADGHRVTKKNNTV